jgi:hypothetical protein
VYYADGVGFELEWELNQLFGQYVLQLHCQSNRFQEPQDLDWARIDHVCSFFAAGHLQLVESQPRMVGLASVVDQIIQFALRDF